MGPLQQSIHHPSASQLSCYCDESLCQSSPAPDPINLTQIGLNNWIIKALRCDHLPSVTTTADTILHKDEDGDHTTADFNYASVIRMIWHLYGHSRSELGFALSQASQFTHSPRRSHELALIQIGECLKGTTEEEVIPKPAKFDRLFMDCYIDADFLSMLGKEPPNDPVSVKSRTGFIISINNCPIVWSSKLKGSIALSTMMDEYYALSTAMRDVLPFCAILPCQLLRLLAFQKNTCPPLK